MDAQGQIPGESSVTHTLTAPNVNTGKHFGTQNAKRRILFELVHHRTAVGTLSSLALGCFLYLVFLQKNQLQFFNTFNFKLLLYMCALV